uniref:RING-type domain-containing protein n=1 Tax=Caenorhabditis tropicalis TaxID=1561998 RepID=A0A1I7U2P9_9PELO
MDHLEPSTFKRVVGFYIPRDLIPSDWLCDSQNPIDNLKSLLEKANGGLDCCGTPEELLKDLKNFFGFSGSYVAFGLPTKEYFKKEVTKYKSASGKTYIYKNDFFTCINSIISNPEYSQKNMIVQKSLNLLFRALASQLSSNSEMMEYPKEKLQELRSSFHNVMTKSNMKFHGFPRMKTPEAVAKQWFRWFHICGIYGIEKELEAILNKSFRCLPVKQNEDTYIKFFAAFSLVFRTTYHFFDQVLEPKTISGKPIVRVFEIGEEIWIIGKELLKMVKQRNWKWKDLEKYIDGMPDLGVCRANELTDVIGVEALKKIEFVKVPITYQLFHSTPIPYRPSGYCIPASFAIQHVFEKMILVHKLFQIVKTNRYKVVEQFIKTICNRLDGAIFIDVREFEWMKNLWDFEYETNFKNGLMKMIREKDDFTMEHVKEEIEYLGLETEFPEIFNFVSSCPSPNMKTAVNETIMKYLMAWFFNVKNPPEMEININNNICDTDPKKEEPKKKKKKAKKVVQEEAPPTKVQESAACPKCFRASEFTRKVNEKLRLSKVENRHLKKELARIEVEKEEKEEQIQILRQKLEEKDRKILEMAKEKEEFLEELHQKFVKMEAEKEAYPEPVITEEVKDRVYSILKIRNTLKSENPLGKLQEMLDQMSMNSKTVKKIVKKEKKSFEVSCKEFMDTVALETTRILVNPSIQPKIPEFPSFSKEFIDCYKKSTSQELPIICASLLQPEELPECLICLIEMTPDQDTVKCVTCTKSYHTECAREWFKVKRTCPTCKSGMLDETEFPSLS